MTVRTPPQLSDDELLWQQKVYEITRSLSPWQRMHDVAADWLSAELKARQDGGHLTAEQDAQWFWEWRQARAEVVR